MDAPIAAARLPVEMGAPPVESVGSEVGIGAVVSIHGESGDDDPGEVLIAAGVVLVEPAGEVLVEAAGVPLVELAGASACGGDEESMSASAGGAIATSRTAVSTTRFMNRGRA